MATTYFSFTPANGRSDPDRDAANPPVDYRENPLVREFRRQNAELASNRGTTPEERALRQAVIAVQRDFAKNWGAYSQQTMQDALDGYHDFHERMDQSAAKALAAAPLELQPVVKRQLDSLKLEGSKIGLAHYWQQDQAVTQRRIQLAQANSGTTTDSPSLTSGDPTVSPPGERQVVDPTPAQLASIGDGQEIAQRDQTNDDVRVKGEMAKPPPKSSPAPIDSKNPAASKKPSPGTPTPTGKGAALPPKPVDKPKWEDKPLPTKPIVGISDEFKKEIADVETRDDYSGINYMTRKDQNGKVAYIVKDGKRQPDYILDKDGNRIWNALGKYQMQDNALDQIKVTGKNGRDDWNTNFGRTYGITSYQDFLNKPEAQEVAFHIYMEDVWRQARELGLTNHVGQNVNGIKAHFQITLAGIIAAAHKEGPTGLKRYLDFMAAQNWNSASIDEIDKKTKKPILSDKKRTSYKAVETRLRLFSDKSYFPNPPYAP